MKQAPVCRTLTNLRSADRSIKKRNVRILVLHIRDRTNRNYITTCAMMLQQPRFSNPTNLLICLLLGAAFEFTEGLKNDASEPAAIKTARWRAHN